jgi:hypothetical protein
VELDATIDRASKQVTSAIHDGTGLYEVWVKGNAQGCSYQVTGGRTEEQQTLPRTYGNARPGSFDQEVDVEMYDAAGNLVDSDFFLAIIC